MENLCSIWLFSFYPQAKYQDKNPGSHPWCNSSKLHIYSTKKSFGSTFKYIPNLTTSCHLHHHPDPGHHPISLDYPRGLLTGLPAYCLTHPEFICKTASRVTHLQHESDLVPLQSPSMSPHFTKRQRGQSALMLDSVALLLLDLISCYSATGWLCFGHTGQLALLTTGWIFIK